MSDKYVNQEIVDGVLEMLDLIDEDRSNIERIRATANRLPPKEKRSTLAFLELAIMFANMPKGKPTTPIKPAAYRKGTGSRVVSWDACPWRPQQ